MIAVSWAAIPGWLDIEFPRQPGPEFDRQMRRSYLNLLDDEKPDIVIMGDSTMRDGVDPDLLSTLTNRKVASIDLPGSASAFWYLIIKNNLVIATHRPEAIVIVFRDTMLTAPGFRVHGGYFVKLDEFAAQHEPVLLERAYLNQMSPVEIWAERYFPLYGARDKIRERIDSLIRYFIPGWLNCNRECTDQNLSETFITSDLEPGQLRDAMASVERYLYAPSQLDFEKQVDHSFLTEIIRITEERGIQLVVVRIKNQITGIGSRETAALKKYISDLSDYLDSQGVIFLDYGREPSLSNKHFKDILHLNSEGEVVFTQLLAEGLNETLK